MFWRFNYMPSRVDSLLDKENVTLQELMDEEDVVQECKSQNKKLIDFLVKPEILEALVHMVVDEPSADVDDRLRYRYPNIACDMLTSDVSQITDSLVTSESLMKAIYSFLDTDNELNPLQASFFSKLMGLLITRKSEMTVAFLKSQENFMDRLSRHIGVSAIMDVLLRLITCIESNECRSTCIAWLNEQRLVSRLVALIDPSETPEKHTNAAQSLCDIIRLSRDRDHISQDLSGDTLVKSIETQETVGEILDHMLNGERVESVIVNGLSIIQTLLESRKMSMDGMQDSMTLMDSEHEQITPGVTNSITALIPRLKDLHEILLNPPQQHYLPMTSSTGVISVPLGQTRLQIARLIAALIMANVERINMELSMLGTISVLLDLFFSYAWNNFLHACVEQCITGIITSNLPNNALRSQLLHDVRLLDRIAEAFEDSQLTRSEKIYPRRGYMGHMTRIANQVVSWSTSDDSLLNDIGEDVRDRWNHCVSGSLADINKLNTTELVGGSVGLASSSDDDDEFRSISFPQDDAMQKAFMEYQQQKMTSDFVEQFGFNEDEFAEQEECIGSPFNERVSEINFELSSVEDSATAAATFETACNYRIHQFDPSDSDEELWEDKEPSFSNLPNDRHSSAIHQSQNTTGTNGTTGGDSDDYASEDSDDVSPVISPRYQQQTVSSDSAGQVEEAAVDIQLHEDSAVPSEPEDSTPVAAPALVEDEMMVCETGISNDMNEVHEIEIDLSSALTYKPDCESSDVNVLTIDQIQVDISKMDSMRLPCLLDACTGVAAAGPDSLVPI